MYVPVGVAFSVCIFGLSYANDAVFHVASGSVLRVVAPIAFAYPFLFVAMLHFPGAVRAGGRIPWTIVLREMSFGGGGWVLAGINSLVICVLAKNTAQLGLIPANIFCIFLYSYNVWNWRKTESPSVGPNQPLTAGAHQPLSVNQLN